MSKNPFTTLFSRAAATEEPATAVAEPPVLDPLPAGESPEGRHGADGAGGREPGEVHLDFEREAIRHEVEIGDVAVELEDLSVYYGSFKAVDRVSLVVPEKRVTALIGPSGCGKSTLLRSLNRMNDLIPGARAEGRIRFAGMNLLAPDVDAVDVRRRIGMVFQKPNPFPKSIYENVAFGARINGYGGDMDRLVEESLRRAALWDEVRDDLGKSGLALSGGQQQRLCIARTIAVEPEVILMDEPASALDPVATLKIEDLMRELAEAYTIVVVTHNMQQAGRVSDFTAFLLAGEERTGRLVEFGPTTDIFTNPQDQRTEDYITGRYG